MSKVKTYVGSDGKLHFVNSAGADTALNFSSGLSDSKYATLFNGNGTQIGNWSSTDSTKYTMVSSGKVYLAGYCTNTGSMGGNCVFKVYKNNTVAKTYTCGTEKGNCIGIFGEVSVAKGDVIYVNRNGGLDAYGYFTHTVYLIYQ